ncbi:GroES-like protein [Lophium mytilinum]|uniref:GroES-like protein n=1 Tax=Lophium mytilinum TaxID=390894 RepID=A0A6A6QBT4_9PEZI|nr:GroES-like protein [Lophium mytilinum]
MPSYEIPTTCPAGVVTNAGPNFTLSIATVPVPTPGPTDLLIRLNATGICYSDIHYMLEDLPMMPSMSRFGVRSPGHEGAGVVVALGSAVTNWSLGDRAGIKPGYDVCFACELCWGGLETYCAEGTQTGLQHAGTYQQYIVSPARYTTRIPEGVSDFEAAPVMCAGATIYNSLKQSGLGPGDWAVFVGAGGGVGHMGVQLAKAMGMRVVGVDGGRDKRELCVKLGCEAFVDFLETKEVAKEVVRITDGKGAHGVFVTATSKQAYETAPFMVRVAGRVMCVGLRKWTLEMTPGGVVAGADPLWFVAKNLHIMGTAVGSMLDTQEALSYAARGLLKPSYEKFSLAQLPEAVDKLRKGQVAGRLVVDFNS